jgi:hypothetical protein
MSAPEIELVQDLWLPDGTVLRGEEARSARFGPPGLAGSQRPRFWTAPPRHVTATAGCPACANPDYASGCGEYASDEMLDWCPGIGYELDDWQQWWLRQLCGVQPDGRWASFENYLVVSRQNGKNECLAVRELAGMFIFGERMIIHTAHEFKAAAEHFRRVRDTVTAYDELRKRVKAVTTSHGDEAIELRPVPTLIFGPGARRIRRSVGSRLRFLARSRGSGRSFTADAVIYDEAMILSEEQVGASLPTLSAVPNPQVIYTASAGYRDSIQLGAVRRRVLRGDKTLMGAEWSVNPHLDTCTRDEARGRRTNRYITCSQHDDRDDPRSWAKANPAFGVRIAPVHIANELNSLTGVQFDRERLGVGDWPSEDEAWAVVSEEAWQACAMPDPGGATRPVVFAVDIDPDMISATIAAAWYRPDPGRKTAADAGMIAAMQLSAASGLPLLPPGPPLPDRPVVEIPRGCHREGTAWIIPRLLELRAAWKPRAVVMPKNGPGASLIDQAERVGITVTPASSGDEAAAFALFVRHVRAETVDGVPSPRLIHLGRAEAPGLWSAVASAETRDVGDGGRAWSRRDSGSDISPVTAGSLALRELTKIRRGYDPVKSIAPPGRAPVPGGGNWMNGA